MGNGQEPHGSPANAIIVLSCLSALGVSTLWWLHQQTLFTAQLMRLMRGGG